MPHARARSAGLLIALAVMALVVACGGGAPVASSGTDVGNTRVAQPDNVSGENADTNRPDTPGNGNVNDNGTDTGTGTGGAVDGPRTEPPPVLWSVELLASEPRRPKWRIVELGDVTVEARFAADGQSILDTLPTAAQESAVAGMRQALSKRLGDDIRAITAWLRANGGTMYATTAGKPRLHLVLIEDPADREAARADTGGDAAALVVSFDEANRNVALPVACWNAIGDPHPGVPAPLVRGLAALAPHAPGANTGTMMTQLWASCLALRHRADTVATGGSALLELEQVMQAPLDEPLAAPFAEWQLADFAGYLVSQYGGSAVATAFSPDGARLFAGRLPQLWSAWLDDRRQLDLAFDPRLDTAWQAVAGRTADALDSMPDPLGPLALRGLQRPVLDGPFGRLAFLSGKLGFCTTWLREDLLEKEFNAELLNPTAPAGAMQVVPLRVVPLPAVLGSALQSVDSADMAARLLDRAGVPDLARLVRWLRGVADDPQDIDLAHRVLTWGATPRGDASLVRLAVALAQRAAGNTRAAQHTAGGLPEGSDCALAWQRFNR